MLVFQGVNDWWNSSYHRLILRHSTNSSRNFLHRKKTRWWFPTIISYFRPYCGTCPIWLRLFQMGWNHHHLEKKKSRFSKDSEEAKKETKHDSQKCLGPDELKNVVMKHTCLWSSCRGEIQYFSVISYNRLGGRSLRLGGENAQKTTCEQWSKHFKTFHYTGLFMEILIIGLLESLYSWVVYQL